MRISFQTTVRLPFSTGPPRNYQGSESDSKGFRQNRPKSYLFPTLSLTSPATWSVEYRNEVNDLLPQLRIEVYFGELLHTRVCCDKTNDTRYIITVTLSAVRVCDNCSGIQVCTFHDGCKQGIDQQIFNRKSISRKITHPQS